MGKRATVMVVDDDEYERSLFRILLEPCGYEILEALDGPACLGACANRLPDLAIIDIQLPGMSGFDLVAELRKRYSRASLPLLMMSGAGDAAACAKASALGADDFLLKGTDASVLFGRIAALLARNHAK